jgi:hypothetical protein
METVDINTKKRKHEKDDSDPFITILIDKEKFILKKSTLLKYPDSALFKMFSSESGFQPCKNKVRWDRDPFYFGRVVSFLRTGIVYIEKEGPKRSATYLEFQFFGLELYLYQDWTMEKEHLCQKFVSIFKKWNSSQWKTFFIACHGDLSPPLIVKLSKLWTTCEEFDYDNNLDMEDRIQYPLWLEASKETGIEFDTDEFWEYTDSENYHIFVDQKLQTPLFRGLLREQFKKRVNYIPNSLEKRLRVMDILKNEFFIDTIWRLCIINQEYSTPDDLNDVFHVNPLADLKYTNIINRTFWVLNYEGIEWPFSLVISNI